MDALATMVHGLWPDFEATLRICKKKMYLVHTQVHQAQPVVYQRRIVAPPDYTYLAVIAVICFFPLGLLALYMANKAGHSSSSSLLLLFIYLLL